MVASNGSQHNSSPLSSVWRRFSWFVQFVKIDTQAPLILSLVSSQCVLAEQHFRYVWARVKRMNGLTGTLQLTSFNERELDLR